jgi:hypothetical protein
MAKKKKNKKKQQSPSVLEAQRRKEFMRRLVRLAKAVGAEETLRWIPKQDLDRLYFTRYRAVRVEAADDNVPTRLLKAVRVQLDGTLNESVLTIKEGCPGIVVKDYMAVALSFYFYLTGTDKEVSTCAPILVEKFAPFIEGVETEKFAPMKVIADVAGLIGMDITRIHRCLYWFDHQMKFEGQQLFDILYMHSVRPEKKKIKYNDGSRLVFRVGWAFTNEGMIWPQLKGTDFGIDNAHSHKPVYVYIQAHAIHRLKERLDVLTISHIQFYLYVALVELKIAKAANGQSLIEFRYNDKKFGYLAFDLVGNMIVIKTFLFLTMDGTPEGEILRQMLGIEAVDKKYLEIDRLSTFVLTDIKDHPEVFEKFEQAGCADLFMLDNEAMNAIPRTEKARLIQSYLSVPSAVEEVPNVEL